MSEKLSVIEKFFPELAMLERQLFIPGMEPTLEEDQAAIESIALIIANLEPYTEEEWLAMAAFKNAELYPQLELPLYDQSEQELPLAA